MIEIRMHIVNDIIAVLDLDTLEGAHLDEYCLHRANLVNANLRGASLRYANMDSAVLRGADLSYADLTGVNLDNAYLDGANLSHTKLVSAYVGFALLSSAYLDHADMRNAEVTCSTFHNVSAKSANLSFRDAKILRPPLPDMYDKYGKLSKNSIYYLSSNIFTTNMFTYKDKEWIDYKIEESSLPILHGVTYDENTKWPKGFDPDKYGAVFCRTNNNI